MLLFSFLCLVGLASAQCNFDLGKVSRNRRACAEAGACSWDNDNQVCYEDTVSTCNGLTKRRCKKSPECYVTGDTCSRIPNNINCNSFGSGKNKKKCNKMANCYVNHHGKPFDRMCSANEPCKNHGRQTDCLTSDNIFDETCHWDGTNCKEMTCDSDRITTKNQCKTMGCTWMRNCVKNDCNPYCKDKDN